MRQVPHYTIIGNGRMATHMRYYFDNLAIDYHHWYRQQPVEQLQDKLNASTHILILIKDSDIDSFIEQHQLVQQNKTLIHFSGALLSNYAHTAHPLQTFSPTLYPQDDYVKIPFIIEQQGPSFEELLPGLSNPHQAICRSQKAYYHSLCVMANNFTTLIWQKVFNSFDEKLHIDADFLKPILQQTLHNIKTDHKHALTGPFARGDLKTLDKNLNALIDEKDTYQHIFRAFIEHYTDSKKS